MIEVDELITNRLPEGIPKEGTWAWKVLMTVADRGRAGATDDELAAILQAPGGLNNIRPRRNELVGDGLLEDTGDRRETASGKTAAVWILSKDLQRALWPRFTARDCELAAALEDIALRSLTSAQRRQRDDLLARVALLARHAQRAAADASAPATAVVSPTGFQVAVHPLASDPSRAAVQIVVDSDGARMGLFFDPAGQDELSDDEARRRQQLRAALHSLSHDQIDGFNALLRDGFAAETWRDQETTEHEGYEAWARALADDPESGGALLLDLSPAELEALAERVSDSVKQLSAIALSGLSELSSAVGDPVALLADVMHWDEDQAQALIDLARRSRQLLFAGPPGTGKTLAARTIARTLADEARIRLVQFHPTYAYEDFVEGIRPRLDEEELRYRLRPGVLRELIVDASATPTEPHFLLIDEINRANLPRVLGELLFGLEYRGPGNEVELPYSGDRLSVPANLWLIGTMNTADRSVALMDAAMRRRFKEFRFDVDYRALRRWHERRTSGELGDEAARRLERLNAEAVALLDEDRAIGHSFLMREDLAGIGFERIWREDLEPVLRDHLLGRTDDLPALEEAFLGEL